MGQKSKSLYSSVCTDERRKRFDLAANCFGMMRTNAAWVFATFALMLFDLMFVKGYQFGIEDHNFYLPQLQAELDPSLYPDSTAIFRSTSEFSFFNPLFAVPARYLGLEWTFLLAYLAAGASFYIVCFLLAERVSGNRLVAYGFLLLMLPLTWAPGTATKVWDSYLIHRGVVLPLACSGVYQILNRRQMLAYFLSDLSALIHPITAATFAAACAGAVAYDLWRNYITSRVVLLAGVALLVGPGPLIWRLLTSSTGDSAFFSPTTPEWVAIVRERAPYMLATVMVPGIVVARGTGPCSSCSPGMELPLGGRTPWSWRSWSAVACFWP